MKLGRLLFGGLTLIFVLVLGGVETIHVQLTRHSLQLQLDAQANETATALALSMGILLKEPDPVLAQTIINPVFDRGYYRSIRLIAMDGGTIASRDLTPDAGAVPTWFRALFQIDEPVGQALVSAGWKQLGRVLVQAHPEHAYRQLWSTAAGTLAWLCVLFALALLAARRLLVGILRPLEAVEAAALEIGERRFPEVRIAAGTREIASVVVAINALSAKLRDSMAHEEARAGRLIREAYEDLGTGTLNARGFAQRAGALLDGETSIGSGAIVMLSISRLEDLNRAEGVTAGDALLSAFGAALIASSSPLGGLVGHDRGASFLVLLPHVGRKQAEGWARAAQKLPDPRTPCTAGLGWFDGAASFEELQLLARLAHSQARQSGESLRVLDFEAGIAGTAQDWKARIESACDNGRIELYGQRVDSLPRGRTLHVEVTSRLIEANGAAMPAALFVPIASRHGLLPRLDAEVLRRLRPLLTRDAAQRDLFAVNVSGASLRDAAYVDSVRTLLAGRALDAARLVFEVNTQGAGFDTRVTADFATLVRRGGAELALDDIELSSATLLLVRELLPAYVKLSPSTTRDLATHADSRYLVESVVALLRPLEIAVLAKGVENEAAIAVLETCGVSGVQGYAASRPARLAV